MGRGHGLNACIKDVKTLFGFPVNTVESKLSNSSLLILHNPFFNFLAVFTFSNWLQRGDSDSICIASLWEPSLAM